MSIISSNKEIITRCRLACKMPSLIAFGDLIGVSKQILTAATKLKKPPLTIISKTAELTGVSYDWLISGKATSGSIPHLTDPTLLSSIGIDHDWAEKVLHADIVNLRYLEADGGNTIYIIDTAAVMNKTGMYAFWLNNAISVFPCKQRVDGVFVIDGDKYDDNLPETAGRIVAIFSLA